jgi:hypothetical protein
VALGDGQQLDDVVEAAGVADVGGRDLRDALVVDLAGRHPGAEGDRGDDGGLGGGVVALDVGGGVGLGVAQGLRLGQRLGVGGTRLGHPREDVVRGAVDDAHDPVDPLAGQGLPQRADERDAAADRRLEQQVDARGLGGREQLGAVVGQQLLVGADHGLARPDGRQRQLAGRLDAADGLDHDVDAGVVDDLGGVDGEGALG